jgi:hypothetical protein
MKVAPVKPIRLCFLKALLLLVLTACKKDASPDSPDTVPVVINAPVQQIVMGSLDNAELLAFSGSTVDINLDGIADLELKNESVKVSIGPNYRIQTSLLCLNDKISVSCHTSMDSIFYLSKTTYSLTASGSTTYITKNNQSMVLCQNLPGSQLDTLVEMTHYLGYQESNVVGFNGEFKSQAKPVFGHGWTSYQSYGIVRDTLRIDTYSSLEDCRQALNKTETYFCFKYSDKGINRFGWLQTRDIYITRCAIMK